MALIAGPKICDVSTTVPLATKEEGWGAWLAITAKNDIQLNTLDS